MSQTPKPAGAERPNDIVHRQARQQDQPQVTPRDLAEPCKDEDRKQPVQPGK